MPRQDRIGTQINTVIEPKLFFLAKLAARRKDKVLGEFIEDAFRLALSPEAMQDDELNVAEPSGPKTIQETPLWMEYLWVDTGNEAEDTAARLFKTGTIDTALLTPQLRKFFYDVISELIKQDKKVTLKNFVECIKFGGK